MSNYILLIMYEYFEKLKNTKDIEMMGTKEIIKESKYIILFLSIAIISLILLVCLKNNDYKWWILIPFSISVLALVPVSENISQKAYARAKDVYDVRIRTLRKILIESDLYELRKIQELVIQCDLACTEHKISNKIIDAASNISKFILLPFITFVSGLIVKNVSITFEQAIQYIPIIILLIIGVVLLAYEIKWFIGDILDVQSRKLNKIKGLLVDISIKDFIKEHKQEISNESFYL